MNTRSSSSRRLPDDFALQLSVYWGGATVGAAVGTAAPYVLVGSVKLTPQAISLAIIAAKKGADFCESGGAQENVLRACIALGICDRDKPDQWVDDLHRLQRIVEATTREAQRNGTIIYPKPPGP